MNTLLYCNYYENYALGMISSDQYERVNFQTLYDLTTLLAYANFKSLEKLFPKDYYRSDLILTF